MDYRRQSREHTPITIDKTPVERVNRFKFIGVHITEDLTWSAHTDAVLKKTFTFNAFSRRFYPKRLTEHSGYTFFSVCVPWESNPQHLRC